MQCCSLETPLINVFPAASFYICSQEPKWRLNTKPLMKIAKVFDSTNVFLVIVAGVIIMGMTIAICVNVATRYLINQPIKYVMDSSELMLLFIPFLSAAWLLKHEGHTNIDIILNQLSHRNQALLNFITSILGTIICLTLTWAGAMITLEFFQRGLYLPPDFAFKVPQAPIIAVIPFGFFLLTIQFIRRSNAYLEKWRDLRSQKQR